MYKPTVPQRYVQHGPKNTIFFFLAKKDATRYAIQKKPLFLYLHWTIKQHITCLRPNTVYVVMCEVHNEWYVGSTTDVKAGWRNHKPDAKLKKATKCGVADHVTKFKHPEDPQPGFFTIVEVKENKDLIVRENYRMCNLGTIFKGMNTRKDLNTVLKDRSSRN